MVKLVLAVDRYRGKKFAEIQSNLVLENPTILGELISVQSYFPRLEEFF